jgi:hypothetical protein
MERTPSPQTTRAFFETWNDAFEAHLARGADPQLMAGVLGVKLAELLARCIVHGHLPRPEAERWLKQTAQMLHQTTWTLVRELKAQPPEGGA